MLPLDPPGRPSPLSFAIDEQGAGPPVVLLGGVATTGEVWDETRARLAGKFHTITVTLRGFDGDEPPVVPVLPAVRAELAVHLRARGLIRPIVVGHSLGAVLGYWLAATEPTLLGGLVALDAAPFSPALADPAATAASREPAAAAQREAYRRQTAAQFQEGLARALSALTTSPDHAARLYAMARRASPRASIETLYEFQTLDLRPLVARITVPVLVLVAGSNGPARHRDWIDRQWRAQLSAIARAEVVVLPGAHHFLMLDAPDLYQHHLDAFLAAHAR